MSLDHRISVITHHLTTTATYTLSLHDALPIFRARASSSRDRRQRVAGLHDVGTGIRRAFVRVRRGFFLARDRKSTRLNSSHLGISYAVFCLEKKTSEL